MKNNINGFITKDSKFEVPFDNLFRRMTDEQLRELFEEHDIPTNSDFLAIIDSKVNINNIYTREEMEATLEGYFAQKPELALEWYNQEMERRAKEEERLEQENIRQEQEESRQQSIANIETSFNSKIVEVDNDLNTLKNNISTNINNNFNEKIAEVDENLNILTTSVENEELIRQQQEGTRQLQETNRQKSVSNMQKSVDDKILYFENKFEEIATTDATGEIVMARISKDGTVHDTLGKRLSYDYDLITNEAVKIDDLKISDIGTWSSRKISQAIGNGGTRSSSNVAFEFLVTEDMWIEDEDGFKVKVSHYLDTEKVIVSVLDTSTKENVMLSYKVLNIQDIELYSTEIGNLTVFIVNADANIGLMKHASYSKTLSESDWTINDEQMYTVNILHRLNSESLFVTATDITTKNSYELAYRTLDLNTAQVISSNAIDCDLTILSARAQTINVSMIDLSDYYNKQEIDDKIENVDVDLSGYATSEDLEGKSNIGHTHNMSDIEDMPIPSSDVDSTSTTTFANSNAVKLAYDKGTEALNKANEAFQNANNGKNIVATAIGSPLSSADTFATIGSKIDIITQNFKGNLTTKGITPSSSDKLTTLVNKVLDIKQVPEGWDVEATGEVMGGNIQKNDATVWQKYGNWDTQLEQISIPGLPYANCGSFSGDGKYLALGLRSSPYLAIYSIENDVFTKLPNPSIMPTHEIRTIKFSHDGTFLAVGDYEDAKSSVYYIVENSTFKSITKPAFSKGGSTAFLDINGDGTVLAMKAYYGGSYPYWFGIATRDKVTNTWTIGYDNSHSSTGYAPMKPRVSPTGKSVCWTNSGDHYVKKENGKYDNYTYGFPPSTDIAWSAEGDTVALSGIEVDGKYRPVVVYSYDLNRQGNPLQMEAYTPDLYTSNAIVISPCSGYVITYINSISACKIYKLNGYELEHLPNQDGVIKSGNSCINFSLDKNYLLTTNENAIPYIYRTTEKSIVKPISAISESLLKNRKVGVALESKNIGEQINVNLFPKLNL